MAGGAPEGDAAPVDGGGGEADGQGAGVAEGSSGLRPNLDGLAPGVKEQVSSLLDQYEGNATKKFQEHAEFRKQWEPYESLKLHEFDPDYLGELIQFSEIFEDEGRFDSWLKDAASQRGLLSQNGAQPGADEGDEGDDFDVPQTKADLDSYVQEKISEALGPIQQKTQEREASEAVQQQAAQLDQSLDKMLTADGVDLEQFDPEDRDTIFALALRYGDDERDPVAKGYEDYKRLTGKVEKGVVERRVGRGRAPEGSGGAAPVDSPQRPKTFKEASELARERARQMMATR
jgi:hypothetical protein